MKSLGRKLLVALLAVCLLMFCAAAAESAEKVSGDYAYDVPYGDYAVILAYRGEGGQIDIPESIDGLPVESVSSSAFSACRETITDLTVPGSIKKLNNAFQDCPNLTNVTVREGVEALGANAFRGCASLAEVSLPASLTGIGANAFRDCAGLAELTVPAGVTQIGPNAFRGCASLASLNLPASLERMISNSLDELENLKDIFYAGSKEQWAVLAAQLTLPVGVSVHCADSAAAPQTAETPKAAAPQAAETPKAAQEPHHVHHWVLTQNTATCIAAGEGAFTCTVCNKIEIRRTEPLGHAFRADFDEATGRITLVCGRCTASYKGDKINGARWEATADAAEVCASRGFHLCKLRERTADCNHDGETEAVLCSACGIVLQGSHYLSQRDHWWRDWEVECPGTCVTPTKMVRTCRHCSAKEEKLVMPENAYLRHNSCYVINQRTATCCSTGYTGDVICYGCHRVTTYGTVIPKNPNLHLHPTVVSGRAPTATQPGYSDSVVCADCGAVIRPAVVLPATGQQ